MSWQALLSSALSLPWGKITESVRDQIPGDWEVPPLVPGQQPFGMDSPGPEVTTWRIWVAGEFPPPEMIRSGAQEYPPHPIASACHSRAYRAKGLLLFGIPSPYIGKEVTISSQAELPLDAASITSALVEVARSWERQNRPTRPWTTRKQEIAAILEASEERVRSAQAEAKRKQDAEEAEKARVEKEAREKAAQKGKGWTMRRGHLCPPKEG